jgi:NADPH:quinone reductase-like Zn-dependent oxidoreductase
MTMMKAVRIHSFGGPEVLQLDEVLRPQPQSGDEALIKVRAASINPVDWKIRKGGYPAVKQEDLPIVLGRDVSGEIVETASEFRATDGEGVAFKVGDAVFAFLGMGRGGYQEYVIGKSNELARKPASLNHIEAAAVPLAGITAWQGLFDHGGLAAGQRVLIHGGAGGVGHLAVQFAKAKGAWVATTVSGDDVAFARGLGVDVVIDYKAQRFEEVVEPVDMVFDLIGGETRDRSFAVVRPGGILVSTLGKPDETKAREHGVRVAGYMAQPNGRQLGEIGRLIDDGKVKVVVQAVYPLEKAADAQRRLEQEHTRGKIVLEVAS